MKIIILAYGSRGDVQPAVALGQGLQSAGFDITIGAGTDFEAFIMDAGLPFAQFNANMQDLVNSEAGKNWLGGQSKNGLEEIRSMRRALLDMSGHVTDDVLRLTNDADVIISGLPLFPVAETIAEKFGKRHINMQFMPLNPTKHGSATPRFPVSKGKTMLNKAAGYVSQMALYWVFTDLLNDFRAELGLNKWSFGDYAYAYNQKVPILYGVSPQVIGTLSDWNNTQHITGYWFYDAPSDWQPSDALCDFLNNGQAPIYIGFGSMSSQDPEKTANIMIDALIQSNRRGIIYSGWAGLQAHDLPDDIFLLDGASHDWLFPQMAGVIHHGGAGTTSAGIRAGVPSTIVWHMGDQPYWGRRIYELGIGSEPIARANLSGDKLVKAINSMTTSPQMQGQAQGLGTRIRQEDGIGNAVKIVQQILSE
ncbi:MAG: glycosyltransferase [Chloroflexota bacterium]